MQRRFNKNKRNNKRRNFRKKKPSNVVYARLSRVNFVQRKFRTGIQDIDFFTKINFSEEGIFFQDLSDVINVSATLQASGEYQLLANIGSIKKIPFIRCNFYFASQSRMYPPFKIAVYNYTYPLSSQDILYNPNFPVVNPTKGGTFKVLIPVSSDLLLPGERGFTPFDNVPALRVKIVQLCNSDVANDFIGTFHMQVRVIYHKLEKVAQINELKYDEAEAIDQDNVVEEHAEHNEGAPEAQAPLVHHDVGDVAPQHHHNNEDVAPQHQNNQNILPGRILAQLLGVARRQ